MIPILMNRRAGRDASRSYVTGCFETHLTHDLRGFGPQELKVRIFLLFPIPLTSRHWNTGKHSSPTTRAIPTLAKSSIPRSIPLHRFQNLADRQERALRVRTQLGMERGCLSLQRGPRSGRDWDQRGVKLGQITLILLCTPLRLAWHAFLLLSRT